MSFENFPKSEPPDRDFSSTERSNNRTRNFLIGGLIVALLGTWGYIIWDKSKTKETLQQKDTQFAAVITEKDTLQSLLDEATMRYDLLKTTNAKVPYQNHEPPEYFTIAASAIKQAPKPIITKPMGA